MARIIDENFEGTGYEEPWTETITGAGSAVDEDSVIPGTPPTGSGSQCLKATVAVAPANALAQQIKTNQNISYIRVYFYIESEGLADTNFFWHGRLNNSANNYVVRFRIQQNSGVLQMRMEYYSAGADQTTAWVNINTGQWYRLEYKYDITNLAWEWKLDGTTQVSGSLSAATRTPDRLLVGIQSNQGAATTVKYDDLIVWDDATWPGAETSGQPTMRRWGGIPGMNTNRPFIGGIR